MKKIYLIIVILIAVCLNGFSTTWFIYDENSIGNRYFGNTLNLHSEEMTQSTENTNIYYLIKEVTVSSATTILFKCGWSTTGLPLAINRFAFGDGDNSGGNAWVYLDAAGTYTLVFTVDGSTESTSNSTLDVIQLAKVSGPSTYFNENWGTTPSVDKMTFNNEDNKFHLVKEITSTGTDVQFKVVARHRTAQPKGTVWWGDNNGNNIFVGVGPSGEKFTVDFIFDPVLHKAYALRSMTRTVGSDNFATFSCPFNAIVPNDATVWYVTSRDGSTVNLNTALLAGNKIPATTAAGQSGTGVILEGVGTYTFTETTEAVTAPTGNLLHGTGWNQYSATANETYVFTHGESDVGFYLADIAGTYDRYRAFLLYSDIGAISSPSRDFIPLDFSTPTSIERLLSFSDMESSKSSDNTYYTLQGIPVAHPIRGIYIHRGKKVVMK